ncbi:MAG: DUF1937 family protein [Pseudomonadota bacterium]
MSLWIMVAGPYSAGGAGAAERAANLADMNRVARRLFALGHVPVIGVNMALPVIAAGEAEGETDAYGAIMMPLSLALADRCDAVLRIGGASGGADAEVERFEASGKPVYRSLEEIPAVEINA